MVKSLKEFCSKADSACELMPSGAKNAESGEKRRLIGFGREGETADKSQETILLEQMGKRRAIGFGRDGETVDIEHSEPKRVIGFGRDGETRSEEPAKSKTAIGFGRENEAPAELGKPAKNPIGFQISRLKNQGR